MDARHCPKLFHINEFFANRYKAAGGELRKVTLTEFADLENEYNVVFNCAGFGAKYLCNDRHVVPIRGQLLFVSFDSLTFR